MTYLEQLQYVIPRRLSWLEDRQEILSESGNKIYDSDGFPDLNLP